MQFNIKLQNDFKNNIRREWALTNGLGGYAGGSVTGAINRTHQGYLIASLRSPVQRYVCFSKTNEKIVTDSHTYDLSSDQFKGGCHTDGIQYIREFTYDGTICFTYEAGDITIKKHIALAQGKNLAAVAYEVQNKGEAAKLLITPLMNFREHSESSTVDSLKFEVQKQEHGFTLIPKAQDDHCIRIAFSGGELIERDDKYICDLEAQTEVDNEVPGLDCAFCPYDVSVDIPAGASMHFSIMCDIVPLEACNGNAGSAFAKHLVSDNESAFKILRAQLDYTDELIKKSGFTDDFAVKLTVAANQFIAHRQSTGYDTVLAGLPWFTDWGRDTMISYTGLTLCTGRFEKAHDILLTFAKYCKDGLIPNMFPVFDLKMNVDNRGSFTELVHTLNCGQVSINISKPGITKGEHWHHSKWEQFIVVSGHGLIQLSNVNDPNAEIFEYEVSGDKIQSVIMLPGYTHNIVNLSDTQDLVTVMYCNEIFNPERPDTFFDKVVK